MFDEWIVIGIKEGLIIVCMNFENKVFLRKNSSSHCLINEMINVGSARMIEYLCEF